MTEYNAGTVKATMTADGKGYHATVDSIKKKDQELKQSAKDVQTTYTEMGIAAGASFAAITAGIWKSVDANNQLKSSLIGLESIAKGTIGSYEGIEKELERVREDGMIPLTNAIAAYKNLLARYKDEETAIKMFRSIADMAAFNRKAHLSLGDAIQSTTEGLKNELSTLSEAGGVTKNLSIMWKEYAEEIGKSVGTLTEAEKRQAEINGFMKESIHSVGDLAKMQNMLAGEMSKASAATRDTSAAFGDVMEPAVSSVVVAYTAVLQGTKDIIRTNPGLISGATAGAFAFTGLASAMSGVKLLIPRLVSGFQTLFVSSGPVGWGIVGIAALTAVIVGLRTAQEKHLREMRDLSEEYKKQSSNIYDLVSEHKLLTEKTEKTADEKERLKKITERLIELSPSVVKGYDDEGQAILDLNIALEEMVNKKREALQLDKELMEQEIKAEEQALQRLEKKRDSLLWDIQNTERQRLTMTRMGVRPSAVDNMIEGFRQQIADLDIEIQAQQDKIDSLTGKRTALEATIQGTTVEALRAEYEARKAEAEAKRRAAEEALIEAERKRQEQALAKERERLETELADRIYELLHTETEIKLRELDKQLAIYKKAKVKEIEIDGEKFTLAQWYEIEKTRILDEETEKRKQIEQDLADWQNRARLVAMDDFDKQIEQYDLDRAAALKAAKGKFNDEEQYKQAELAINQYYDGLIAKTRDEQEESRKKATDQRIQEQEKAIRKEYEMEKSLTEWEKQELLKRLQAELSALEAMTDASAERIEALKNVISELSDEIPNLADVTKRWTEDLVDGLSRAIVEGESLADVFDNLLRTITQYFLKQAMMGGLASAGFPSFHGGGKIERFHWGGVATAFAGAIRAHGGLKLERDEVPIIAQTGERILSRAQNAAYEAGVKPEVNIEIVNNTGTPIETRKEVDFDGPRTIVRLFMEGFSRNMEGIQDIMKPR